MTRTDQHAAEVEAQEALLRGIEFMRDLDRVEIARLIGATEDAHFDEGAVIVEEGAPADALYLLAAGQVEVSVQADGGERVITYLSAPAAFGEFGVLLSHRSATVRAVTRVQTWRLPRGRFERLVSDHPSLGLSVARQLAGNIIRRERDRIGAPPLAVAKARAVPSATRASSPWRGRVAGATVALAVPALLWWLPPPPGLSTEGWRVMAILLGGAIAWLLEPIPDFAVALAVGAAWGIGGFAPPSVVLSGFASSSWLLAVAAIGISAAMASSGLLFRAALALLRVFPATERGQVAGLLVGGAVITPFVPSVIGRVATVAPIARDLAEALGRPRSPAIAFAAVVGATVFGPIFLTGVITNFLVLSLLPAADQTRFDWIGWLLAAAPAGVILLLGSAIVLLLRAPASPAHVSAAVRRSQERSLGRMSRRELVALIALGVFAFGLLLQPFLRADAAWIGLVAMLVAIGGGALDRQTFRSGIDWSTVTFFGVLIGSAAVLRAVGVDRWIAGSLAPIARSLEDPVWTIALLAAVTIAVRLLLPMIPAGFLLLITLVPAASELGLDGWVVGFVVATLAFTWLLPRQYEVIRMTRGLTGGQMFTERDAVWFGIATTAVALIALGLSIPVWRAMGLL